MKRTNSHRISRIALFILVIAVVTLAGMNMYLQFLSAKKAAEVEAHRAAHVVATQFQWMLQTSAQALQRIGGSIKEINFDDISSYDIREAVADLPIGLQHSLYDANGTLILSSDQNPRETSIRDRTYFQRVREGERSVIQPMVSERLTGEKVFILARRIERAGLFAGIASIAIPVNTLEELADTLGVSEGSTISLIGTDGMVVARFPPIEPINLSKTANFQQLLGGSSGVYTSMTSPADGTKRIVGFWKVDGWPLIAVAGINNRTAFSAFRKRMVTEVFFLISMIAGMAILFFWLFRLQAKDVKREQLLAVANERSEFLMQEIHHRVKNNLQSVISLIRLQKLPHHVHESISNRIGAMVSVHEEMYESGELDLVPAKRYLERIISNIAEGYGKRVEIDTKIEDVKLLGDQAMQLGLIANELITNSFKYAFEGRDTGHLEIKLEAYGENCAKFTVHDDGPGKDPINAEDHMGSKLITAFVAQINGNIEVDASSGYRVAVEFPLIDHRQ